MLNRVNPLNLLLSNPARVIGMQRRFYLADAWREKQPLRARVITPAEQGVVLQVKSEPQTWWHPFGGKWVSLMRINERGHLGIFNYEKWSLETFYDDDDEPQTRFYQLISLSKLYGIPQSIWDQFLNQLAKQEVVNKLGLQKHRHLWDGYNGETKLATTIGNYHFILDILNSRFKDVFGFHRRYERQEWKHLERVYDDIKSDLQKGHFDAVSLSKLHPGFSPAFLKKTGECHSFSEVLLLAEHVHQYSIMHATKKESMMAKQNATNWIPSVKSNPKEFVSTLRWGHWLDHNTPFFFSNRRSWPDKCEMNPGTLGRIRDYVDALFNDLVYREVMQQTQNQSIDRDHLLQSLRKIFSRMIYESHSMSQLDALQQRWHRNFEVIQNKKPTQARDWQPLIDDMQINNVDIKVLTFENELRNHGREMGHCVGGYARMCMEGKSNILVLHDKDNLDSTSTLELVHTADGKVRNKQHRTRSNYRPNQSHVDVANELVIKINKRQIPVNSARLKEKPKDDALLPYDLNDLETQETIYQAYVDAKVLPAVLTAMNYSSMLLKSKISQTIIDCKEGNQNTHERQRRHAP